MKGTALRERERERVRTLLSLIAHAIGYKMMVGTHNIVVVRHMWEVLPYSPCMVDHGAHNNVDVQRHVGGALPRLSGMGVDGIHNTIGQMLVPTTLLGFWHAWKVAGHPPNISYRLLFCSCAGYSPGYYG